MLFALFGGIFIILTQPPHALKELRGGSNGARVPPYIFSAFFINVGILTYDVEKGLIFVVLLIKEERGPTREGIEPPPQC